MRKLIAPFLAIFLVVGCVSSTVAPETPRERLAAAEVTYAFALSSIDALVNHGLIEPGTEAAHSLGTAIIASRAALDAWQAVPNDKDRMVTALSALRVLQSVLNSLKAQLQSSGQGV